jgi:protein TonB
MAAQVTALINSKTALSNKTPIFRIAIFLSILAHVAFLSITFKSAIQKKFSDHFPVLEVMLVNAKTASKPDHAENFAQANLDRGGNTEQDRKMKSALPSLKPKPAELTPTHTPRAKSSASAAQKSVETTQQQIRVAELEKVAQALMTQIRSTHKVDTNPAQKAMAKEASTGKQENPSKSLNLQDINASAIEMEHLEALISKQQDEYQKRPKRKFIGARTKEYRYALYVDAWRQKVEQIGNLNYPAAAKDQQLYGQLQLTVSIRADGSIEKIELNRSSGHKLLDEAAKHIVEMGAPYARFPEDISKEIDVLSITRTWTFTKEDSLSSE